MLCALLVKGNIILKVHEIDLTKGHISKELLRLAIPIMGTGFIEMAYNLTDMMWIGQLGSYEVAAIGTAGFYFWLMFAFILIPRMGAEVLVSQAIGKGDLKEKHLVTRHVFQMAIVIALVYGAFLIVFRHQLIGFFDIQDANVVKLGITYLVIVACGSVFAFLNPIFTALFNAHGNSKTPFRLNTIGLVTNMVLDPILIFGLGPIPALGVAGAAIATIFAQVVVSMCFIMISLSYPDMFGHIRLMVKPNKATIKRIFIVGWPAAIQSGMFTIFAMIIARVIANWGPIPIAVQRVVAQIEAISWRTSSGFATALTAFVGQNYGAKLYKRIIKGYRVAMTQVSMVGIFATLMLLIFPEPIISLFLHDAEAIEIGVSCMRIMAVSQIFMCIEITTAGAFNGLGKTLPPSIVSILFNGVRVLLAFILSADAILGLDGVWWSISISSIFKGVVLVAWFVIYIPKLHEVTRVE